jgi:hypothetical protein
VWQQAVKALQEMTKDSSSCQSLTRYDALIALCEGLQNLPPPPKAAWKKLVQQLQVRKQPNVTKVAVVCVGVQVWVCLQRGLGAGGVCGSILVRVTGTAAQCLAVIGWPCSMPPLWQLHPAVPR